MYSFVVVFRHWSSCTENDNVESSRTCGGLGGGLELWGDYTLGSLSAVEHGWRRALLLPQWPFLSCTLFLGVHMADRWVCLEVIPAGWWPWQHAASSQHVFLATDPARVFLRALGSLGRKANRLWSLVDRHHVTVSSPQGLCWPPAITAISWFSYLAECGSSLTHARGSRNLWTSLVYPWNRGKAWEVSSH